MPAPGRRWQATLIVALFFVAVTAAAFTGWWYARESPPHQGPIVLISANNLPARTLASYGGSGKGTPAIDGLAAEGIVFDRAYAHSPQTLPAHASLFSGQLPFEHGVRDDAGFAVSEDARTLAELLRNRGFNTGAAVSTYLLRRESGIAQGFAFFDAQLPETTDGPAPAVTRDAAQTLDAAERWVQQQDGQRFLLFVQVGAEGAEMAVNRLAEELKARDLYDSATVVFIGDHGDSSGTAPLSDNALHVPLIVKQPGNDGAGRRVAVPVQQIDVLPTILDLVRAPIPSGVRGRSLRPILDDDEGTVRAEPIYAESLSSQYRLGGYPMFGLTSGNQRLIRGSREELFDLIKGGESLPLDTPEAERLRTRLDQLTEGRSTARPATLAAADEDAFAALGYLPVPPLLMPAPVPLGGAAETRLLDTHRAAARLVAEKKYSSAIERLRSITRSHPELAAVHYQTGWLLLRVARLAEAMTAFREAARLQPDNAHIAIALATTAMRGRDLDTALAYVTTAVALAQEHQPEARAAANVTAARVALARMDAEAATRHAEAAQQADPSLPLPQFIRGQLLFDEGRYEDALQALQAAVAVVDDGGTAVEGLHASLGDALARLERDADAEAQYRREIERFPRSIRAYSSLAMLYAAASRDEAVEEVIDDLVAAAPTPEGYAVAARLWATLGNRGRAEALRADARTRFRGDPSLALLERP